MTQATLSINTSLSRTQSNPSPKTSLVDTKTKRIALGLFLVIAAAAVTTVAVLERGKIHTLVADLVPGSAGVSAGLVALGKKAGQNLLNRLKGTNKKETPSKAQEDFSSELLDGVSSNATRKAARLAAGRVGRGESKPRQVQYHFEYPDGLIHVFRDVTYVRNGFILHQKADGDSQFSNQFAFEQKGFLFTLTDGKWKKMPLDILPASKDTGTRVEPINTTLETRILSEHVVFSEKNLDETNDLIKAKNLTSAFRYVETPEVDL